VLDETGAAIPDAVSDPVLADFWDNSEDAVYDGLVAPSTQPSRRGIADEPV
jgi:hypothetical protein